ASDNDDPAHDGPGLDHQAEARVHAGADAGRAPSWPTVVVLARHRVLIACTALRTNLTVRELAAVFQISKSATHRIVAAITRRLAELTDPSRPDRRWSWIVDGTLIPTRDHACAAKSKNYRWSCNAQILVRRHDLRVIATSAGGPGNRNDPMHYRG